MKKIILKIGGMSCSACQKKLEKYLNNQDGVNALVNLVMQNATVEYDDLTRIEWRGFEPSENGAIYYMCEYNGAKPLEKFKVTSKLLF